MTRPRYLYMAMPPPAIRAALYRVLKRTGLDTRLGRSMFKPENWHLSLSSRFWEAPGMRETLLCAGQLLEAPAVTLRLNRITGHGAVLLHWAVRAQGTPPGFTELLGGMQAALSKVGIADTQRHTPHITVSYWAPTSLATVPITPPLAWRIDEVLLVVGCGEGNDYHYDVIGRWPLTPADSSQLCLF